jgi:hypothetical protein
LDFRDAPKPAMPAVMLAAMSFILSVWYPTRAPNLDENFSSLIYPRSGVLKLPLSPSRGVNSESRLYLRRRLKSQSKNPTSPTRANPPITPPTIGVGDIWGLDRLSEVVATPATIALEVELGRMELLVSVAEGKPFWLLNGSGSVSPTLLWVLEVDVGAVEDSSGVESCRVGEGVVNSVEEVEVVLAVIVVLDDGCVIGEVVGIWTSFTIVVEELVITGIAATATDGEETEGFLCAGVLDVGASETVVDAVVVILSIDVVVVVSPVIVVKDRGTAVHRFPLSVVMRNPAGRFTLVDIMERE